MLSSLTLQMPRNVASSATVMATHVLSCCRRVALLALFLRGGRGLHRIDVHARISIARVCCFAMAATRLYLVRHGATQLTAEDRFSGAVGVELSDEGRWQAARSASGSRTSDRGGLLQPAVAHASRRRRSSATAAASTPVDARRPARDQPRPLGRADARRGRGALPRRVRGVGGGPVHVRARGRRVGRGRARARAAGACARSSIGARRASACSSSRTRRRSGCSSAACSASTPAAIATGSTRRPPA